ncbi:uncharacterized protein LOC130505609, partial [Raphanus sativus]|uniref:Uncharacterized protein LOC130505609 n=1 Tax=Raphanus sativus TaxID=3726 RepID=A0A9W3CXI6_RAPSA
MRHDFAPDFTSSEIKELYPRRYPTHGSKDARKVVAQESKRGWSQQANLQPNQGHAIVQCLDQKSDIPKAMENRSVSQNTLIRTTAKPLLDTMQVKAKVSPIHDNLVYESSSTGISHLSLSENVKTGPEVKQNPNSIPLLESRVVHDLFPRKMEIPNQKKEEASTQGIVSGIKEQELKREDLVYQHGIAKEEEAISEAGRNDLLLKEAKPVIKVSNQGKCLTTPLDTGLNFYNLGTGIPDESSMLTEVPRAEPDHELNQNPHH